MFGYIALISKTTSVIFQYLFCIFNSIQGLLIFLFHNIREPTVQSVWVSLCSSGVKNLTSANGHNHGKGPMRPTERKGLVRDTTYQQSSSSNDSQTECHKTGSHPRHQTMSESLSLTRQSLSMSARKQSVAKNRIALDEDDVFVNTNRYLETSL